MEQKIQTSYVMVKPGFANYEKVIDEIEKRLYGAGLKIIEEGYISYDRDMAGQHYYEHVGKDFYQKLEDYITSDKAYGMIVEGQDAIAKIRAMVGSTMNPQKGTIRFDIPAMLGRKPTTPANVVHASDSEDAAQKEIQIFKNYLEKLQTER